MGEEEDDDESFGDFTFASFPTQQLSSTSNDTNPVVNDDDDDDWGDFMNHSNNQINGTFSKPFDPFFAASPDPPNKHVNDNDDNNRIVVQAEPAKTTKGEAIPLSIFGEVEEEEQKPAEPAPASPNVFSNGGAAKKGSDSNGSVGIGDLISSLYNQHQPRVDSRSGNGSVLVSNVAAPNPTKSNESKLNEDEDDDDDDDGWEFKSAEWESGTKSQDVKAEVPKHDNGALDVGTVLDASNGTSDKAGGWGLDFEFSPTSASQNHIGPQPGSKSESNGVETGFAVFSQNFGELSSGSGSNQNSEVQKKADIYPTNMGLFQFDDATPHGTIDSSLASESHQSDEWNFGFNFNSSSVVEDSHSSESYFKNTNNQDDNNKIDAFPTNINVDSNVNLFESKSADTKHENPLTSSENRREALPLSIFGAETPNTDEHPASQDLSMYAPTSSIRNSINSTGSNLAINEMIWNLYNQAENQTSNVTPKASENQIHASPEVSDSSLITGDDDFDDDSWDFKDALTKKRFTDESAQETSFDHAPQVSENGLQSSPTVFNSDLTNGGDDFEDDSWEFKDAISETRSQDHTSTVDHQELSTESEQIDYVEFFSKLKDELCNCVLFHLQNLKKTQNAAALLGEDDKAKALQEEIQEFSKILHQDNMGIPNEYISEDYFPRNVHFDELLEVLKEPKFQSVESEYQLASRLLMAKRDIKSTMELLKETASTLRILKLESAEVQSNYLIIWSKIASVCSQELKHGAYVWKQAVLQNIHDQILSNQKGAQYILALGEIYRVAEIIGASAKLLRPWMLSGSIDLKSFSALLNECYSIWLASGLEEALLSVSNQNNFEPDDVSRELVESIKYIHELDEHALQSYVISGEQTTCQLSALPADFIPGLNLVTWNGKHYFVKLANLWVNLISSDPPKK